MVGSHINHHLSQGTWIPAPKPASLVYTPLQQQSGSFPQPLPPQFLHPSSHPGRRPSIAFDSQSISFLLPRARRVKAARKGRTAPGAERTRAPAQRDGDGGFAAARQGGPRVTRRLGRAAPGAARGQPQGRPSTAQGKAKPNGGARSRPVRKPELAAECGRASARPPGGLPQPGARASTGGDSPRGRAPARNVPGPPPQPGTGRPKPGPQPRAKGRPRPGADGCEHTLALRSNSGPGAPRSEAERGRAPGRPLHPSFKERAAQSGGPFFPQGFQIFPSQA